MPINFIEEVQNLYCETAKHCWKKGKMTQLNKWKDILCHRLEYLNIVISVALPQSLYTFCAGLVQLLGVFLFFGRNWQCDPTCHMDMHIIQNSQDPLAKEQKSIWSLTLLIFKTHYKTTLGLPRWLMVKNARDVGDTGLIPGLGRSTGVGNDNLLQYSYLENSMDRGTWKAAVHGVTKSCVKEWQIWKLRLNES